MGPPDESREAITASPAHVPGVVNFDTESLSLADTTLGDATASGIKKKRPTLKAMRASSMFDSFDEGSIYTSGNANIAGTATMMAAGAFPPAGAFSVSSGGGEFSVASAATSMILPPSLSRSIEYEEDIMLPISNSQDDMSSDENDAMLEASKKKSASLVDLDEALSDSNEGLSAAQDSSKQTSPSGGRSQDGGVKDETVQSDEDRAGEFSKSTEYATKGFDPFAEDSSSGSSSLVFDSHLFVSRGEVASRRKTSEKSSGNKDDEQSALTVSSSQTQKVENTLGPSPGGRQPLISPSEEEKREVDDEAREDVDKADVTPMMLGSSFDPRVGGDSRLNQNNNLLRHVLEDARRLAEGTASRSRISRQSAPPRLASKDAEEMENPIDILADTHDLEKALARSGRKQRNVASRSVGAHQSYHRSASKDPSKLPPSASTRAAPDKNKKSPSTPEAVLNKPQLSKRPTFPEANRSMPPRPPVAAAAVDNEPVVEQSKPPSLTTWSPELSQISNDGAGRVGAEPRDPAAVSGNQHSSESPASSPGVLGISVPLKKHGRLMADDASSGSDSDEPWLFDAVEQTLGPRSPDADLDSISVRSNRSGMSNRSNRSNKSNRSSQSKPRAKHHPPPAHHRNSPVPVQKKAIDSMDNSSQRGHGKFPLSPSAVSRVRSNPIKRSGEYKSDFDGPILPRSLENDLKRLEANLQEAVSRIKPTTGTDQLSASSFSLSSSGVGKSLPRHHSSERNKSSGTQMVVVVPPGKLGVILADRHDGKGTVVSEVRSSSAMSGMLTPGDKLGKKQVGSELISVGRMDSHSKLFFVNYSCSRW